MNTILIALSYAFCWGVGTTLTKLALSKISATTLLIIQLISSVLFLAIACYIKTRKLPFSLTALKQGIAGIFEPALAYMVGIFGVNLTTASNAVLIGSSEVILTILMAAVFLGERLTRSKLLLALISFWGIALLVWNDEEGAIDSSLIGNLLILLGTLFAVFYVMVSKKQIGTADPLQLTTSQQFVGLIMTVFCFGILSTISPNYEVGAIDISLPFWLLAIGSGIMQYAIAYLLYLTALQNVPASQAAFFIALIPTFGVASAAVILGEHPSLTQWVGGAFVIMSSYWANRLQSA